jgi:hypothetical protein
MESPQRRYRWSENILQPIMFDDAFMRLNLLMESVVND